VQSAPELQQPVVQVVAPINAVLCAAVMAVCLALAWTIVFMWHIGPVIATLNASAGQGVHSGDFLALPVVGLGLLAHDWLLGPPSR
jgi:hypothetical protein